MDEMIESIIDPGFLRVSSSLAQLSREPGFIFDTLSPVKLMKMKNLIICVVIGAILFTVILFTCSCSHWCDPANIQSGKSMRHHDSKPFRAKIKIINAQQQGSSCYVKYYNMQQTTYRLYEHCSCKSFKEGSWINIDSI